MRFSLLALCTGVFVHAVNVPPAQVVPSHLLARSVVSYSNPIPRNAQVYSDGNSPSARNIDEVISPSMTIKTAGHRGYGKSYSQIYRRAPPQRPLSPKHPASPPMHKRSTNIVLTGSSGAGKRTLLEKIQRGNMNRVWGGMPPPKFTEAIPAEGANGVVFVADVSNREQIEQARQDLRRLLVDRKLRDAPLLVFGNKCDRPGAISQQELADKLGLANMRDRTWYCHPSCFTSGDGVVEGLSWLFHNLKSSSA